MATRPKMATGPVQGDSAWRPKEAKGKLLAGVAVSVDD